MRHIIVWYGVHVTPCVRCESAAAAMDARVERREERDIMHLLVVEWIKKTSDSSNECSPECSPCVSTYEGPRDR